MPELPDVTAYIEALEPRVLGHTLNRIRFFNPFVLRSVEPPAKTAEGRKVVGLRRLGKRIVLELEDGLFLVIHLMIAGRLRWSEQTSGVKPPGKLGHAALEFDSGTLMLVESSSKKRASIHLVQGEESLRAHNPGGVEPLECSVEQFAEALTHENRTLKRALTNSHNFSGIGNAYSDEILHSARLSPMRLTRSLKTDEIEKLYVATQETLKKWVEILRKQFKGKFPGPGQITAFRPEFAAHGKFGEPCPVCGAKIQRIRYEENETNYCANCQNEGRLLADRALSRLLKDDWPKTLEEMEG